MRSYAVCPVCEAQALMKRTEKNFLRFECKNCGYIFKGYKPAEVVDERPAD